MYTTFAKQVKKAGRDFICIHYQNMDLYFPHALVISCPFVGYKSVVRPSIQFTDTLRGDISSVQYTYNIIHVYWTDESSCNAKHNVLLVQ